ncbi:hypothetical protein [Caudoviricetes sp.]|nr:hypothetical protein [Caudoviricetes sp.]
MEIFVDHPLKLALTTLTDEQWRSVRHGTCSQQLKVYQEFIDRVPPDGLPMFFVKSISCPIHGCLMRANKVGQILPGDTNPDGFISIGDKCDTQNRTRELP